MLRKYSGKKNYKKRLQGGLTRKRGYDLKLPIELWMNVIEVIRRDEKYTSESLCEILRIRYDKSKEYLEVMELEIDLMWNMCVKRRIIVKGLKKVLIEEIESFYSNDRGWAELLIEIGREFSEKNIMVQREQNATYILWSKFEREVWEKVFDLSL
jgi:hypothetical protein